MAPEPVEFLAARVDLVRSGRGASTAMEVSMACVATGLELDDDGSRRRGTN